VIELADGLGPIGLLTDLVVRAGQHVTLFGQGNLLRLGRFQLRVEQGGELRLNRIILSGAAGASALLVQGKAGVERSAVRNCTAALNFLSSSVHELHSVRGRSGRGLLLSVGGGFHVMPRGFLILTDSEMAGNSAAGSKVMSLGGAIAAINATVRMINTTFIGNKADGEWSSIGGAVYSLESTILSNRSRFIGNTVKAAVLNFVLSADATAQGGALALYGSNAEVISTEFFENMAEITSTLRPASSALDPEHSSSMFASGGAIFAIKSTLQLSASLLNRNAVTGPGGAAGGALHADLSSNAEIVDSDLVENSAAGGTGYPWLGGGGIIVNRESALTVSEASICRNYVRSNLMHTTKQSTEYAMGGALMVVLGAVAAIAASSLLNNSVFGPALSSQGGGAYLYGKGTLRLVRVTLADNVATGGFERSEGGAVYSESSCLFAVDTRVTGNMAGDLQGGDVKSAYGGAFSLRLGSTINLSRTLLLQNSVHGSVASAGGAIYAVFRIQAVLNDCELGQNTASSVRSLMPNQGGEPFA
jgi:hypothetical protein